MKMMKRFAVYYAPCPGSFADKAAAWLGWDTRQGRAIAHPELGIPLAQITTDPRKYGFHGTIRAPFRPATGVNPDHITDRVRTLAAGLAPVRLEGLALGVFHGFLALTPKGDTSALLTLAEAVVRGTNDLRAPLTDAEIARRRPETLTPRQQELLRLWGYPGVMEAFQFHLTLTNQLPDSLAASVVHAAEGFFAADIPDPFVIEDLCLFGEDAEGRFHLLYRYPLSA